MSEENDCLNNKISEENEQFKTTFKTSDYDLDLHERKAKFYNYNLILCENCNEKIDNRWFKCDICYIKETNIEERQRIQNGRCKECFQIIKEDYGCLSCNQKRFQRDFGKWTSGNKNIDKLIQDSQLSVCKERELLEWIPYNRFTHTGFIAKGGFANVYSAKWIDGYIENWSQESNNWNRHGPIKVALKILNDSSETISEDFLNEVKIFKEMPIDYLALVKCYGVSRDPTTQNYILVLELQDSGLRSYLNKNYDSLTWENKLDMIINLCAGLHNIHISNLVHKDLHMGNVLISTHNNIDIYITICDFGFCKPINEISSNKIYGVMPYMAPEILRGEEYTTVSDIYSLGIIMNEIITISPPFNKEPHDFYLALDICRGKRPKIRNETPDFLKDLIQRCFDADPEKRPSSKEIVDVLTLNDFKYENGKYNYLNYTNKYRRLVELSNNSSDSIETIKGSFSKIQLETHPQAIYSSRHLNLSNLPKPENCSNQQDFRSSRPVIMQKDECTDCAIH